MRKVISRRSVLKSLGAVTGVGAIGVAGQVMAAKQGPTIQDRITHHYNEFCKAAEELALEQESESWLVIGGGSQTEGNAWRGHSHRLSFNVTEIETIGTTVVKKDKIHHLYNIHSDGLKSVTNQYTGLAKGDSHV